MGVYNIAVIKGDGIGPEVVDQALLVLEKIAVKYGHSFHFHEVLMGGASIDRFGVPITDETIRICRECDAVLLGAVGGPKWDSLPSEIRPEKGLLRIRSALGLYANLRPAVIHRALKDFSPLKDDRIGDGIDVLIVRELTGGIYFGERGLREGKYGPEIYDTECYSEFEIRRIAKVAFEAALRRNRLLASVDKANVLDSSKLWRKVVSEMGEKEYPDVKLSHMYVDNAAMQLTRAPGQFDVILSSNLFGDILSDEAGAITGSIGLLPSASLAEGSFGLYEPVHGSAPDIAGKDQANPMAAILSAAMLLRYSLDLKTEADDVESAVESVLEKGLRTPDIACASAISDDSSSIANTAADTSSSTDKGVSVVVGTRVMGQAVVDAISA